MRDMQSKPRATAQAAGVAARSLAMQERELLGGQSSHGCCSVPNVVAESKGAVVKMEHGATEGVLRETLPATGRRPNGLPCKTMRANKRICVVSRAAYLQQCLKVELLQQKAELLCKRLAVEQVTKLAMRGVRARIKRVGAFVDLVRDGDGPSEDVAGGGCASERSIAESPGEMSERKGV